jgi:hypothetical protein
MFSVFHSFHCAVCGIFFDISELKGFLEQDGTKFLVCENCWEKLSSRFEEPELNKPDDKNEKGL